MKTKNSQFKTNQLVVIALLSTLAYVVMVIGRVPMIAFLKYDPKDIVIMLAGMALGPYTTVLISIVVSFIEFLTVSSDGPIGLLMNIVSTVAYVTLATIIYKKKESSMSLLVGLIAGTLMMTAVMVAWNYVVTPFYLQIPRAEVVQMLVPIIVPFNLIKSTINSAIIFLIHKPILNVFSRANLIKSDVSSQKSSTYLVASVILVSSIILVVLINNM